MDLPDVSDGHLHVSDTPHATEEPPTWGRSRPCRGGYPYRCMRVYGCPGHITNLQTDREACMDLPDLSDGHRHVSDTPHATVELPTWGRPRPWQEGYP